MSLQEDVKQRSNGVCELCGNNPTSVLYEVLPQKSATLDNSIFICEKCDHQIHKKEQFDANHWRSLSDTMWSEVPGVQVMAWRILSRLKQESWASESLDMLYLADETLEWAKALGEQDADVAVELHKDCNGVQLLEGDSVVLTKSLDVKGSSINAKMGTVVKNIRLVADNPEQIEGKIEGQMIVILTKYLRKQGA